MEIKSPFLMFIFIFIYLKREIKEKRRKERAQDCSLSKCLQQPGLGMRLSHKGGRGPALPGHALLPNRVHLAGSLVEGRVTTMGLSQAAQPLAPAPLSP